MTDRPLTHGKRRLRRRAIAEHAIKHGIQSACKEFGVSITTVRNACMEFGMSGREEKKKRRKSIAEHAKEHGIESACKEFDVCAETVRISCKEHGVTWRREQSNLRPAKSTLVVLRMILDGKDYLQIAKEIGASRQYVSLVANEARRAGIEIPCKKVRDE